MPAMRWVILIAVLLAGGIVTWLVWQKSRPEPLIVSGFVEADQIRVGSRVGGRVAEVLVQEGDRAKAGAPLLKMEPFDLNEQLAQAQAELAARQADYARLKTGFRPEEVEQAKARRDRLAATLAKLQAGPRSQEISVAEQRLKQAQASLDLALPEYQRLKQLAREGTAGQLEADRAEREFKAAQAEVITREAELALLKEGTRKEEIAEAKASLAETEAALRLMEAGSRSEDIEQARAKAAAAEAEVATIRTRLEELTVRAPADVIVDVIDLRPGDIVPANAPSMSLLDQSKMWVRAYVPAGRLGQVKLGQRVPIRVDAFPDKRFEGAISYIATEAEFTPRNTQTPEDRSKQVFRIKVTVEDGKDLLRPGMMGDVMLEEAR